MLFSAVMLCILAIAGQAQEAERPVLDIPWAGGAGLGFTAPDGTFRSFSVDVARAVAEEAGVDLNLIEYPSASAVIGSFRDGETDMLAGVGRAAFPEDTALFAGPIARTEIVLFVPNDAPFDMDLQDMTSGRIAVVRNTVPFGVPLPDGVGRVVFDDPVIAFAKMLHGEVDGVLAVAAAARRTLATSRLDTLVRPTSPPIRELEHFIALQTEFADLVPEIEAALSRLEADGTLQSLRETWFMVPPPPVPDVLTVGVTHFPPYYIVEEDASVSGFGVEVIRELADRASLDLRFEIVSLESWLEGPRVGSFDLLPARSVTAIEREVLDFTVPIQTIDYVPFVRAEDANRSLMPQDGRIGILFTAPVQEEIAQALGVDLVALETPEAAVSALAAGRIDALFYPRSAMRDYLAEHGGAERFARLPDPEFGNDLAIAMRPGLADLEQRLNIVIQGFIGSARYREIAARYFDPPPFWTPERIRRTRIAVAGMLLMAVLSGVLILISGRRRARRHAREMAALSDRLGVVLDTARSAILGFDQRHRVVIANKGATDLIPSLAPGQPQDWPDTVRFYDLDTGEPLKPEHDPVHRALAGTVLRGEVALLGGAADGPRRHVRISSSTAPGRTTGDIRIVIIIDDISSLYESQRAAEEQARIAAAAQRQESIGKLTGGIAHDFNNLLAVILGNLELLEEEGDPEKRARKTRDAISATLRGAELVSNMLAFARRAQIEPQVLSLNEIVREVKSLSARTLPASVDIETSLLAGLWQIRADRSLTENALLNLILNASDAMDGHGRLTIETTNLRTEDDYIAQRGEDIPPGRYVMLAVSDDGPGIPDDTLEQIFEPFFTTKGPQGGSGLGLSMVMGFMKQTGGMTRVYTEVGVGTTFKLFFPAVDKEGETIDHKPAPREPAAGLGQRVLLVEDQSDVRKALCRILEGGGYAVTTAASGDNALEIFETDPAFDLVVTDIVMPGRLQGPKLVQALRAIRDDLPAIFISGYAEEAAVHGNGLRPEDIRLMKPVQRKAFLDSVARALAGQTSRKD